MVEALKSKIAKMGKLIQRFLNNISSSSEKLTHILALFSLKILSFIYYIFIEPIRNEQFNY